MIKLTKQFVCIKSVDSFLTEGKEYIGESASSNGVGSNVFFIRDNGDETWVVSSEFFLEKNEYLERERESKIDKIIKNGSR
jgi:CTP:phosphocholine cytidylyltransferase-like protein